MPGDATPAPASDALASGEAGPAALRGGAMRSVGYGAGVLLTLVSAPILIRHLGVADFGRYTTVVALVAIVAGVTEAGLNAIVLREYATRSGADRDIGMRQLLGIRVVVTSTGIGAAVAFGVVAGYDRVLLAGTVAAGLGLLLASLQGLLTSVLQARLRFGWATVVDLVRQALTSVLIIALAAVGSTLLPFLAVPIAAGAVGLVGTALLVRGATPLRPSFSFDRALPLIADTLPYAAATALNATYFRLAVIVMSIQASELQTGYYATAFRVVEVLVMIPVLGVGAAFPILARAAKDDPSRFRYASRRVLELGLVVGTWVALCVVLGAQVAIDLLAGDAQPAVAVLQIQGVALVAAFLALAAVFPLLSLRRHKTILLANGLAFVASILLTLVLVPVMQARGAALAITLAEATSAAVLIAALARVEPGVRSVARAVPAVVLATGAALAVTLVPGLPAVLDVLVGSAVYFAVLAFAGRFPPEVRDALRRVPHATLADR